MSDALVGMVLCAGLGTRLRPLTHSLPKPAVPVCGLPLVGYSLALLAAAGARRAVVNVHHLPDAMEAVARDAARALRLDLQVSREPIIAGTGGALREARHLLSGAAAIAIVNGDILFDVDLGAAVAAHRASGALATMVLLPMPAGARYNAVELDPGDAVRRIAGRFGPGGEGLSPWHFSGVHVVAPELLRRVPDEPAEVDIREVYAPLMATGQVRGHRSGGYWNDLGTPARYLEACEDVLAGRLPLGRLGAVHPLSAPPSAPGLWLASGAVIAAGAVLRPPLLVGPGARVEAGAAVGPLSVIGAGALVPRGATVEHAVLWDGTELAPGERLVRAVAAGPHRVPAVD